VEDPFPAEMSFLSQIEAVSATMQISYRHCWRNSAAYNLLQALKKRKLSFYGHVLKEE